jgi:hypothetical protein
MNISGASAVRAGWVCSFFALASGGCSDDSTTVLEPVRAEQGSVALPLRAEANGIAYRLRAANFDVTGAESLTLHTDDAPDTLVLRHPLQVGDYQIELLDGWHLERQLGTGFEDVSASPLSPKLQSFSIAREQTTSVAYDFRTERAVIGFSDGDLALSIGVKDSELCGTGGKIEELDDGDPCTIDRCDAVAGVVHELAPDASPDCGGCGVNCGNLGCNGQGQCNCPAGQTSSGGSCRLNDGQACTVGGGTPCLNGCTQWFSDGDSDGFGNSNTAISRCGTAPPAGGSFVRQGGDCCDTDGLAFPGQTQSFVTGRNGCGGFDFNCNNREEPTFRAVGGGAVINNILTGFQTCADVGAPPCNDSNVTLIWPGGRAAPCGTLGNGGSQCFLLDGACQGVSGFGIDVFCR